MLGRAVSQYLINDVEGGDLAWGLDVLYEGFALQFRRPRQLLAPHVQGMGTSPGVVSNCT